MSREGWGLGRRLAFVVPVGLVAMTARPAYAQGAPPSAEAERRFDEGLAAANAGDYQAALHSFTDAYRDSPLPRILFDIAAAEEKLGRFAEAFSHYRLVAGDPRAEPNDRADATDHLHSLASRVGHVDLRAPSLAEVGVDGHPVEAARLGGLLDVVPGHHAITVRVDGAVRSAVIDVAAEQRVRVNIGTEPEAASTAPAATLEPDRRRPHVPAAQIATVAVVGALAIGAFSGGVYFAVASHDEASTAQNLRSGHADSSCAVMPDTRCSSLNSAINRQNDDAAWSNRLYVAGGVLAAGAVATWFLWPRPRARAAQWVVPAVSAKGFGLSVGGTF
jgi:hypothetical protein